MIAQIAALPRSGTAFLTVLLNLAPNCLAFHELIVTDYEWKSTWQRYAAITEDSKEVFADVGTYQFFPVAIIPESAKVLIRRHPEDSRASVQKSFGYDPGKEVMDKLSKMSEAWAENFDALVIEHSELFTPLSLERIWRRCNPHYEYPAEKVDILLSMNITRLNGDKLFSKDALRGREKELWG